MACFPATAASTERRSARRPTPTPTPAGRHRNDKQSPLPFQLCTYSCGLARPQAHSGRAARVEPQPQLLEPFSPPNAHRHGRCPVLSCPLGSLVS